MPPPPPDFISLPRSRELFAPDGSTILMYHKIAPPPLGTRLPALYVTPRHFRRQVEGLRAAGLPCLSMGEAATGNPGYCLSFDDGFRNVFEHALPALQACGARAIQFIVAGLIGRSDEWDRAIGEPPQPLMDAAQIREWLAAGHEIGAHTMTHPRLSQLPLDRARAEIVDSRRRLEDLFGRPVRHFCYPYGDFNPAVRDLVAEAGYESACTIQPGINRAGAGAFGLSRALACDKPLNSRQLAARLWRLAVR